VCTEFPKDKEFRAFEMLEKIGFSLKPRRCETLSGAKPNSLTPLGPVVLPLLKIAM
jgi:hypothetical protein